MDNSVFAAIRSVCFKCMAVLLWGVLSAQAYASDVVGTHVETGQIRRYMERHSWSAALMAIDRQLDSLHSVRHDSVGMEELWALKGICLMSLGNSVEAIRSCEQARQKAVVSGNLRTEADVCNTLFMIYNSAGRITEGEDMLLRAFDINTRLGNRREMCKNSNNLAITALSAGDMERASKWFGKALEYAGADSAMKATLYLNIAEMERECGNLSKALQHQNAALNISPVENNAVRERVCLNKITVLIALGRVDEARKLKTSLSRSISDIPVTQRVDVLAQMADVEFQLGDSLAGLRYVFACVALEDSLRIIAEKEQINDLIVAYDAAHLRQQAAALNANLLRQRILTGALVVIAILIIILISVIAMRRHSDSRKNALIAAQNRRLLEIEKSESMLRQQQMQSDLDSKQRQLTSFTINIAAVSEMQSNLIDKLSTLKRQIAECPSDAERAVIALMNDVSSLRFHTASEDFMAAFNGVHPDFFIKLSEHHPRLSENDLRVCAFLALGMSSKEIATLMFREVRSIESTRNRLRKKLDLEPKASLQEYLRAFLNRRQ